jgi:four helix bundle protein
LVFGFGFWFLVLGFWFLVLVFGFRFLVFGFWFLVFGSWFLVLGSWFLVLGPARLSFFAPPTGQFPAGPVGGAKKERLVMQFDNTRIYQRAMELASLSHHIIGKFPRGYGYLADQLRRASSSVVLNFAEGYGKQTNADQRRFFTIARGSACEVAAVFDLAYRFELIGEEQYGTGREMCDHLARMLTRFRA